MTDGHTQRLESALAGRYKIQQKLGEGGMASVYLAEDVKHERNVALKILKPELAAVIGAERFLTEIKTTANLQHPHILPLFDSGESDGFLYYVMPYIEGETLQDRIAREGQLGVEEAVRIARDVADALDYAHRNDIIHRDIKPANILLHDGRPVVADFGIALAISAAGGGRMTETGLSLGTPHYMSPEQASADRDLSARSDVYSLGCVLYEMLAGQPPHTGPSAQNILVRILTEDPRDVTELRRTVPPHVAATVMKSIEKLPADRFGTAKEFLEALADEGFSYQAQPTAAAARTVSGATPPLAGGRSWVRDWRIVASLLLAMASSGLAGALWLEPEPELTTTRLSIDLEDIGLTAPHRVEVSQDGARFVMSGVDAGRSLYVRDADEQSFRLIPGTESGQFPAFSPSGDWIVYRENGTRSLQKVAVSGGAPRPVVAPGPYNPSMPDWSVDGSIVFISDVTELYQVSETGGEPKLLFDHSVPLANPRQLPGGDKIIMTDVENQLTVLLHVESGLIEELLPGGIDARYVETGHLVYADLSDGLWAVRFDAERGEITGEVTPIFSGLTTFRGQFARYSVSQTGTLVYSTGGGSGGALRPRQRLLIVGMDGQAEEVPIAPRIYRNVRWSPDGASIAFSGLGPGEDTGSSHIYVYNVDLRTAPRQLTFEGTQGWPVWSPDGQRLAFNSTQGLPAAERPGGQSLGATGGANLHVQAAFDDSEPMLVLDRDDTQFPYSWPDSSVLVFTDGSGGTSDLLMLDMADSGAVSEYLNIEADLGAMRISPDGRRIAYGSSESGSFEIYVRSFPQARQQVIISENGGDRPRWSPEGDALYYWKVGPGPDTLMMARLQDEPAFGVVSREVVLEADYVPSTWDIHPSGDRFIIAQDESQAVAEAAGGPVERFFVVVNWFEELKAALGEGN